MMYEAHLSFKNSAANYPKCIQPEVLIRVDNSF